MVVALTLVLLAFCAWGTAVLVRPLRDDPVRRQARARDAMERAAERARHGRP